MAVSTVGSLAFRGFYDNSFEDRFFTPYDITYYNVTGQLPNNEYNDYDYYNQNEVDSGKSNKEKLHKLDKYILGVQSRQSEVSGNNGVSSFIF